MTNYFKYILQPFQLLVTEFSPYRLLIVLTLVAMALKIGLESLFPLLLVPIFSALGGDAMMGAESGQLAMINNGMASIQAYFGFGSQLETTFYVAMLVVIPKALFTILYQYLLNHVTYTYENNKRKELFSNLLGVHWTFYLRQNSGSLINTFHTETGRAGQVYNGLISLLDAVVLILFYLIIAAFISWSATLCAVGAFLFLALILIPLVKRAKYYGEQAVLSRESLMHHLNQLVHSFKVLKGSCMETAAQKFITDASSRCRFFYVRTGIIKILPNAMFEPVIIILLFGLIYAANVYSFVSLGQAGIIAIILYRSFNKSANIHKFWIGFYEFLPSLQLMNSLPKLYQENQEERSDKTIDRIQTIQFDHVSFQYPTGNVPALADINLHVNQGEYIGIVGSSGSGKTTFVDTVLDLLKPSSGSIVVNGTDLKEIDPWKWREAIGYVPQESIMFNDTVKNNIALYRPQVCDDDIAWAASVAHADEFIHDMPEGYNTMVGERGSRLSGGQKQRLALARALVHKPQILLLDEATSALDTFTEKKIQSAVDELKGKFTILVVAHRLSTVINADKIIVLDEGRIVQEGTPSELLALPGHFQSMYQEQFKGVDASTESLPNPAAVSSR